MKETGETQRKWKYVLVAKGGGRNRGLEEIKLNQKNRENGERQRKI